MSRIQGSRRQSGRRGKPVGLYREWAYGPFGADTAASEALARRLELEVTTQKRAESRVAYDDLSKRQPDTAINVMGRQYSIGSITPPVVVCSYAIPNVYVFKLNAVGFQYNDPILMQLDPTLYLPWRIEVDGVPLPFVSDGGDVLEISPGSVFDPFPLDKCWIQGGQTVAVVVRPNTVTIEVNVVARIQGELYKQVGLELGERV